MAAASLKSKQMVSPSNYSCIYFRGGLPFMIFPSISSASLEEKVMIPPLLQRCTFRTCNKIFEKFENYGHDHICLIEESRTLFGLSWKGWFLLETHYHLDKAQAHTFITISVLVLCSRGVPVSQYTDDPHLSKLRILKFHPTLKNQSRSQSRPFPFPLQLQRTVSSARGETLSDTLGTRLLENKETFYN